MLYRSDVCNCTMPYVPRTVPAYAVRDPAYTAEVFALTLVEIDVNYGSRIVKEWNWNRLRIQQYFPNFSSFGDLSK